MIRLKKDQKQKVREFTEIAGVSSNTAIEFLKAENFNVQNALNRFYNSDLVPMESEPGGEQLFKKYKSADSEEEMIDVEGVVQLIQDLGIDSEDKALIAFAHLCQAKKMGEFSRAEFCMGCDRLNISTTAELSEKLPQLRRCFDNNAEFESIYNFVFLWACPKGKKILDLESAVQMWGLLFSGQQSWQFLDAWCSFLEEKHGRPINADTWKQLLSFAKANGQDFSNYDENQAWPVLIDDFVEHVQQNG